ncbi:hypothetical protein RQP46_011460 [Phenoliferia psychrophenolica]
MMLHSPRAHLFTTIHDAFDLRTPLSKGLTMYYSTVPSSLRHRDLPIPSYSAATVHLGPFEHRPAGSFLKFTMHRSPLEELVSRWRTGDIRAIIARMGSPTKGMTPQDEAALLRDRDATDWDALLEFRERVVAEREAVQVIKVQGHRQVKDGAEFFANLAFAAAGALEYDIAVYLGNWNLLERRLAGDGSGPFGRVIVGVASAMASVFGCCTSSGTSFPSPAPAGHSLSVGPTGRAARSTAHASSSVSQDVAQPSFDSGPFSALELLAVRGQRRL